MMSSSADKNDGLDADSVDSKSVSSKPENDDKRPTMRCGDTSFTTYTVPSSATATVSTEPARHPTSQPGLPTFAAAAAAPTVPQSEKKPGRAGFGDDFLPVLRVMLDRESQKQSSPIQWSTDGNSFIITDHTQFENLIPTYFDNPIGFSSFLRKLYRWGFNRVSSRLAGRYEFGSSTFKRLHSNSAPSAAAAVNTSSNDGGGAPVQVQQQPTQAFSSLLQQVMAQTNQQPTPNPLPASQAVADAITALLPSIQHQLSIQQPSMPSQAPSSAQLICNSPSPQGNALHTLVNLLRMCLLQPALPTLITSAEIYQLLVLVMQRIVEEELHRRAQADAINHAIILTIGQIVGGNNMIEVAGRQRDLVAELGQTNGNNIREITTPNVPLRSGMTLRVPYNSAAESQQVGTPPTPMPPPTGDLIIQADSIAATLQAARRRDVAAVQLEEDAYAENGGSDNSANEDGNGDDHEYEGRPLSARKRKSPDDDQYDADDDSWNERLRPRKKSPH